MIVTLEEKCIGIDIGGADTTPVFPVLSDRSVQERYQRWMKRWPDDVRRDKLRLGGKVRRQRG